MNKKPVMMVCPKYKTCKKKKHEHHCGLHKQTGLCRTIAGFDGECTDPCIPYEAKPKADPFGDTDKLARRLRDTYLASSKDNTCFNYWERVAKVVQCMVKADRKARAK